jgi:hypothetical protein
MNAYLRLPLGADVPAPVVDDSTILPSLDIAHYSVQQFETDMSNFKPRTFDTYVLPAFMMYFAWKAKGMPKLARRMLFVAGIYMGYRNYAQYKALVQSAEAYLKIPEIATGNASTVEAKA